MQLLAKGKWSKAEGRWQMVVAMRRPSGTPADSSHAHGERRPAAQIIRLADRRAQ